MANHTPGPWTIGKSQTRIPIKSGSRTVAYVQMSRHDYEDACVIVTGPEMLAALKEIIRFVDSVGSEHINRVPFVAARAVIAKAEGK